jgi:hypothetical protein
VKVTMALFRTDVDCISVLAFGTDGQKGVWKRHYSSVGEVIAGLRKTGVVTALEATELQTEMNSQDGFPFFKGSLEREELESAGFSPVVDSKPN